MPTLEEELSRILTARWTDDITMDDMDADLRTMIKVSMELAWKRPTPPRPPHLPLSPLMLSCGALAETHLRGGFPMLLGPGGSG